MIVFFLVSLTKFCYIFLIHAMHTTCCAYIILADLIILIISGDEYKLCISSLHNFLQLPVTFSLLGPNILLITLFSNTVFLYKFELPFVTCFFVNSIFILLTYKKLKEYSILDCTAVQLGGSPKFQRQYVPPKRWAISQPHSTTTQNTPWEPQIQHVRN